MHGTGADLGRVPINDRSNLIWFGLPSFTQGATRIGTI